MNPTEQSKIVATNPCAMRFRKPVMVPSPVRKKGVSVTQCTESTKISVYHELLPDDLVKKLLCKALDSMDTQPG